MRWKSYRRAVFVVGIALLLASAAFGAFLQPGDDHGEGPPGEMEEDADAPDEREDDTPTEGDGEHAEGEGEGEEGGLVGLVGGLSMEHSYTLLFLATVSGVLSRGSTPGVVRVSAQKIHRWFAYGAGVLIVLHILTQIEAVAATAEAVVLLLQGELSTADPRMVGVATGVGVGTGAVLVIAVAMSSFLRPALFGKPFVPIVVHAFAYIGFAFSTFHAVMLGHEATKYVVFTGVVLGLLALQGLWTVYHGTKTPSRTAGT